MIRKLPGIVISVSVASGRARCQAVFATMAEPARLTPGVCAPKMGNQRSRAAKTAMKIIPSQNDGVDSKNMEMPSDPRSKALPRRQATSVPQTTPTSVDASSAPPGQDAQRAPRHHPGQHEVQRDRKEQDKGVLDALACQEPHHVLALRGIDERKFGQDPLALLEH